ncbi:hypothetical protein [Plantactinospora endophytica]|uniref:WXG100 family type VII secretion target n=1 Tax=Plantactinospora endophytica TaxID=673535 RepID=A0ABQ4E9M2_9ACTN|nr:hypothetical protein [Plantactinospora endophytica]GIG91436.1 hypothetical protein Pen02_63720 [Plantactinospora endophytica]
MSFEQLMQHAEEIRQKAIDEEVETLEQEIRNDGTPNVGSLLAERRRQIEQAYADVPDLFEPFTEMPDPSSFDGMIAQLAAALHKLSSGEGHESPLDGAIYPANVALAGLPGVTSYIEDWTGAAAMEFKTNFVDPFSAIVQNQFLLTSVLKVALEAEQAIWAAARNDIDKIAHDALAALDSDGCGPSGWTMTFTVVAAIVATTAAPVGAVSVVAGTALTAVGSAVSIVGAVPRDTAPSIQFSAGSPSSVISQMREAISMLIQEIHVQESEVANAMSGNLGLVSGNRGSYVSPRPALAGADGGDITGPDYMGYSS